MQCVVVVSESGDQDDPNKPVGAGAVRTDPKNPNDFEHIFQKIFIQGK